MLYAVVVAPGAAQAPAGLSLQQIASGLTLPVYVTAPPGDGRRLMVVEQGGAVRVLRDGQLLPEPFLTLTENFRSGGERGLLSIAFAPDYETTRLLYAYYTDAEGDIRVDQFRRAADSRDRAEPGYRRAVIEVLHREAGNHNGGQVSFGPDGLLYLGTGDGGNGYDEPVRDARDLSSRLGKVLRIAPTPGGGYTVPGDNPYTGSEVWARGLRNPFRFSFDRKTGDLAIGDVGQDEFEEIDYVKRGEGRGADFGWSAFEARERFDDGAESPDHVPPVIVRQTHGEGGDCSVIGGYVLRAPKLGGLDGQYVYGDYCNPQIRIAKLEIPDAKDVRDLGIEVPQLSSFGEDADGNVYAVSQNGPIYRLEAK